MTKRIKLYTFVPFDRGGRVRWLANELGYEIEEQQLDYAGGEHRRYPYMARNPFGLVPAIEIDGETRWDSVAICQSLAEQHPESGLVVAPDSAGRGEYLSWLMFCATSFDTAAFSVFKYTALKPDEARSKEAQGELLPLLVQLARHLERNEFVLGERFTLPDIVLGYAMQLLYLVRTLDQLPVLQTYRKRLAARPAAKAARMFTPRPG